MARNSVSLGSSAYCMDYAIVKMCILICILPWMLVGFDHCTILPEPCYKIQFKKSILGRDVVEGGGFWLKGGYRGKIEVR